jgi:hypothetical protein
MKSDLELQNELALREYLGPKIVNLSLIVRERFNPIGSGVLFLIGTRLFILTASHVIQEMKSFSRNLITDIKVFHKTLFPVQPKIISIFQVPVKNGLNMDLAWLEIENTEVWAKDSIGLDNVHTGEYEQETDGCILTGFPEELIDKEKFEKKKETALRFVVYRTCFSETELNDGVGRSITLDYPILAIDDVRGGLIKMPNPKGCSGGGMWLARKNTESVWHIGSRLKLMGIDIEWDGKKRTVKGTKIINVLDAMKAAYPELEQEISRSTAKIDKTFKDNN